LTLSISETVQPTASLASDMLQRTSHMEPSVTSTTITEPIGQRLQAGTEYAPVLDRPAQLKRLRDSGAGYPDLLTHLLTILILTYTCATVLFRMRQTFQRHRASQPSTTAHMGSVRYLTRDFVVVELRSCLHDA